MKQELVKIYITKPVSIQAALFDGTKECFDKIKEEYFISDDTFIWKPINYGAKFPNHEHDNKHTMFIETLEGTMRAEIGDYIIRGLRGEYYPCKPDVFNQKYMESPI